MEAIAGVLGLAYSVKIFRYLGINKQMSVLWLTLASAANDMLAFIVGYVGCLGGPHRAQKRGDGCVVTSVAWLVPLPCRFVCIMVGFAIFGEFTFGFVLVDFHNFLSSASSLLRFPLGDFSYDDLTTVTSWLWLAPCLPPQLTHTYARCSHVTRLGHKWRVYFSPCTLASSFTS